MDILPLIAGFVALLLAHVLRPRATSTAESPPGRQARLQAVLGAAFGFAAMVGLVGFLADRAEFARLGEFDRFTLDAVRRANAEPDKPVVLFLGASFTRNALDPDQLAAGLKAQGHDVIVVNLSMQGASYLERGQKLDDWFARIEGLPQRRVFVFSEVSGKFDTAPAFVFRVGKFSDRAIRQFDLEASLWALNGLVGGACAGLSDCVLSFGLLPVHAGLNITQFGLLATGERRTNLRAEPAFDPQTTPRDTVPSAEAIAEGLRPAAQPAPATGPQWAVSYRRAERLKLAQWPGVAVGYYFPPVVPAEARAYARALCEGELRGKPCLVADDPDLLRSLEGPLWLDAEHLLADGARLYGDWLIDALAAPMAQFMAGPGTLAGGEP